MRVPCVIGVDLGGTNVRAETFSSSGASLGDRVELPSRAQESSDACADAIAEAILSAAGEHLPDRVGLAVPGHIHGQVVKWAPNFGEMQDGKFRQWRDVPLGEMVSTRVGLPVEMGNDANLAALGEYRFGTGRGTAKGLVMITLGTGIGTGVVLSPECVSGGLTRPTLLIGGNGGGAELGHVVIVKDGEAHLSAAPGTLEAYCGAAAIVKRAGRILGLGSNEITPRELFDLAEAGDSGAIEVWRETGEYLGVGIANMINAFAPEVVAVGGQISKAGEWILGPARESARTLTIPSLWGDTRIVQAEQFDDAGILGAVALALESE